MNCFIVACLFCPVCLNSVLQQHGNRFEEMCLLLRGDVIESVFFQGRSSPWANLLRIWGGLGRYHLIA